jgi:hypothetical protein
MGDTSPDYSIHVGLDASPGFSRPNYNTLRDRISS